MKKERSSNFELMRILIIIMIIMWHIIIHGHIFENVKIPTLNFGFYCFAFLLIVHVNCFVLLTGFFQHNNKVSIKKVLNIYLQIVFLSLFSQLVASYFNLIELSYIDILQSFLPSKIGDYWFIANYIIMYLFSDYFNILINKFSKEHFQKFLIIVFVIFSLVPFVTGLKIVYNDGYTLNHFIALYFLGAYLNKYPLKEHKIFQKVNSTSKYRIILVCIYLICAVLNIGLNQFAYRFGNENVIFSTISSRILATQYSYARPFVIIQSVAFFEFFRTLKFKSKIINYISPAALGIYILTDSNIFRNFFYKLLKVDIPNIENYNIIITVIVATLLIYICSLAIEIIRWQIERGVIKLIKKKRKEENFMTPDNFLNYIGKWFTKEKRSLFIFTVIFGIVANILLITNDILFTDSIVFTEIHFSDNWELSLGRWLLPYIDHFRWGIASHVVSTLLALVFLSFTVVLLIDLFKIKSKVSKFIISTMFAVAPFFSETLFSVFCSAEFTLSCLLATLSIYLVYNCKNKYLSILVPSFLLAASLGLYQSYIGFATALCILIPLYNLIKTPQNAKEIFKNMLKSLAVGIIAIVIYEIALNVILSVWNQELASYSGANEIGLKNFLELPRLLKDTFMSFHKYYFTDGIINNLIYSRHKVNMIIFTLLMLVSYYHLFKERKKLNVYNIGLIVVCIALIPVVFGIVELIAPERDINSLMDAPYVLIYVFFLSLIEFKNIKRLEATLCWLSTLSCCYISFSYLLMANATYMAARINTNETIYAAERIVDRIETEFEFDESTKIMFTGNTTSAYFNHNNKIFIFASGLTVNSPLMWGNAEICNRGWHNLINYYLGKDFTMVNYEEYSNIVQTDEFKEMGVYPEKDSIIQIDNIIVIKMLENPSLDR